MPPVPESLPSETKTIPLGDGPAIPKRRAFPKIAEVREMLKERAAELLSLQRRIVYEALANQDYETANDANKFLLTHLPSDENGTRLLDPDIDKPKDQGKLPGPSISIGFAIGGLNHTQSLPPANLEVIDAVPETQTEERQLRGSADSPTPSVSDSLGPEDHPVPSRRDTTDS